MSFMQKETYHGHWQRINNTNEGDILTPEAYAQYSSNEDAAEAYKVPVENVETVFGWGARLSAPGYLDCTDWTGVFETEQEALDSLSEMYEDEEDEETLPRW